MTGAKLYKLWMAHNGFPIENNAPYEKSALSRQGQNVDDWDCFVENAGQLVKNTEFPFLFTLIHVNLHRHIEFCVSLTTGDTNVC